MTTVLVDPWLQRWLPLLQARTHGSPVLEIGCGSGDDTVVLAAAGLQVLAFDLSTAAVCSARTRVPSAVVECRDIRDPWPPSLAGVGAIVASLSLHYFTWADTLAIWLRLQTLLRPGGVLVCRLNATDDHHFGASGHLQIEPNYFQVNGEPKRFFDKASIDALFTGGWHCLSVQHFVSHKYLKPKALWEVVAEKACDVPSAKSTSPAHA